MILELFKKTLGLIVLLSTLALALPVRQKPPDQFKSEDGFSLSFSLEQGILNRKSRSGFRANTKRYRFLRARFVSSDWTAQFSCSLAGSVSGTGGKELVRCEKYASWRGSAEDYSKVLSFNVEREMGSSEDRFTIRDFEVTGELEKIVNQSYFPVVTALGKGHIPLTLIQLGKVINESPFALSKHLQGVLHSIIAKNISAEEVKYSVSNEMEMTVTVRSSGKPRQSTQVSLLTVPGDQDSGIATKKLISKRLMNNLVGVPDR